ncbi:MAG: hypothetical protein WAM70_18260, partial [Pyrinomonadaceae bacterium]
MTKIDEMVRSAALERTKPSSALDRIADEALKRHLEASSSLDSHAHRAAIAAAIQNSLVLRDRLSGQLFEPIFALRDRLGEVSQVIINQGLVAQKALAAVMLLGNQSALQQSRELIAAAAFNSVLQFRDSHRDLLAGLAGLRSALDRDLSPMLAAIQTMRGLGLADLSPEFSEYVSETLGDEEESGQHEIPKTTSEIFEAKSKGLTSQQQFNLMLALTLLSIFIALYQAIQAGQPIKIDPAQLEQLKAHPEVTINIYNIFSQMNERVEYEVKREVA